VGFSGRGEDANRALRDFPDALRSASRVARAIERVGGLGPFVASSQAAANAADPVRTDIAEGFSSGQRTLGVFATHGANLERTLDEAPLLLRSATAELPHTSQLLRAVRDFSRAAVPALTIGRGALSDTSELLRAGRPGLRAAPGALNLLRPATPAVLGLMRALDPVLPPLQTALQASLPPVRELAPRGCDLHRFVANWASILSWGNDFSNYLRYNVVSPDTTSAGGNPGPRVGIFASPYPRPCEYDSKKVPRP
jgi:ABC-type transporter Mla subunit MlaD